MKDFESAAGTTVARLQVSKAGRILNSFAFDSVVFLICPDLYVNLLSFFSLL